MLQAFSDFFILLLLLVPLCLIQLFPLVPFHASCPSLLAFVVIKNSGLDDTSSVNVSYRNFCFVSVLIYCIQVVHSDGHLYI